VKLLRVLDGVPYYRLGGVRKVSVDVRVVAATNANLEEDISKGRFRNDLFHRLAQVHVQVPPLRKRPEEILQFAQFFLRQRDQLLVFSADAQQALQKYAWPGNLRELKNVVTRCAILTDGGSIESRICRRRLRAEQPLRSRGFRTGSTVWRRRRLARSCR